MRSTKNELSGMKLNPLLKKKYRLLPFGKGVVMLTIIMAATGCVKKDLGQERDYGYSKVMVECEKKCSVSFGTPDKMNSYDIDSNTSVYYIRYQSRYHLDINITPIDEDQKVMLSVYSRQEKQVFHDEAVRKANELWYSSIIIP